MIESITDFIMGLLLALCALIVLGMLTVLPYAIWKDLHAPTFELKKNEWNCTREEEYTTTGYMMVGKIMVPQTYHHERCIEHRRIK